MSCFFVFLFYIFPDDSRDFCHLCFCYGKVPIIHAKSVRSQEVWKSSPITYLRVVFAARPYQLVGVKRCSFILLDFLTPLSGFKRDNSCQLRSVICQIKLRGYAGGEKVNVASCSVGWEGERGRGGERERGSGCKKFCEVSMFVCMNGKCYIHIYINKGKFWWKKF